MLHHSKITHLILGVHIRTAEADEVQQRFTPVGSVNACQVSWGVSLLVGSSETDSKLLYQHTQAPHIVVESGNVGGEPAESVGLVREMRRERGEGRQLPKQPLTILLRLGRDEGSEVKNTPSVAERSPPFLTMQSMVESGQPLKME